MRESLKNYAYPMTVCKENSMLKSVVKLIIVFGVQGLFLYACDAGYSETGDVVSATVTSKTQNDAVPAR